MKIVRIALTAVALSVVSVSIAAAQSDSAPPSGMRRGGGMMMGGRVLDGITLSDAQKAQQTQIREKYMPEMMQIMTAVRSTGAPPDSATRAKMTELMTSYNVEMRAILTPDQQVIFDKNLAAEAERRAKMSGQLGH